MNSLPGAPGKIDVNQRRHEYMIRFQNTGTAAARNVELRDTLAARFETGSLKMLGASHSYTLEVLEPASLDGTVLVWRFQNIMLPDSNTNEPASHGHVRFSLNRQAGMSVGDSVPNKAGIYFDFNPVVMTNTVSGEVADKTSNRPEAISASEPMNVQLYPNPSSGDFILEGDFSAKAPAKVRLLDIQGRLLMERRLKTPRTQITTDLNAGVYLLEVQQGANRSVRKVLVQ
jgi:hypothetical protein